MKRKRELTEHIHVRLSKHGAMQLTWLTKLIDGDRSDVIREALRFISLNSIQFDREVRAARQKGKQP